MEALNFFYFAPSKSLNCIKSHIENIQFVQSLLNFLCKNLIFFGEKKPFVTLLAKTSLVGVFRVFMINYLIEN